MELRVERVDSGNADDYARFVSGCATAVVQQTRQWSEVIEAQGQDKPLHLIARDESGKIVGALPGFVFENALGNILISVPQPGGYGGIVVREDDSKEEIYQALLDAFVREAREAKCIVANIATAPFFGDIELYRKYLRPEFERENFYQYLDLRSDFVPKFEGESAYNIRRNLRRNIKTAQDSGLNIVFEDTQERFEEWYLIHEKRMGELKAAPLPRGLFEAARRNLFKDGMGFFAYAMDKDRVVGGALFVGLNRVLDIFMMSADSACWEKHPNSLLVFETLKAAQKRGYMYYNWQSSSSRQSSVYHFKQGWGSREGTHFYLTKVVGDAELLLKTPLETIKREYRWHFVMPYDRWSAGERKN